MLLVYAMTRAAQHGWSNPETIGLLVASAALDRSTFVAIELRSKAPLLPLRIFRLRTLTAPNITGFLVGAALFSQFFLLTLYMQQVLHYSAIKTGVAYLTLTLAIIVFAAVAQASRDAGSASAACCRSVSRCRRAGSCCSRSCRSTGHYFWDLFPAFLLSGIGLALSFVPMTIAALIGVDETDAGIASGLINTSQQIGGAVGLAAATTIATTFTNRYVDSHAGVSSIERRCARLTATRSPSGRWQRSPQRAQWSRPS